MTNFVKDYNAAEIYSDFKVFKLKTSFDNPDSIDNNSASTSTTIKITIKAFRIIDSDFEMISKPCIKSKQTLVVCQYKSITPIKKKLEEIHVNFKRSHNLPLLFGSIYMTILISKKIQKL